MLSAVVGGQSWVVGKLASTGESAGVQDAPLLGPPWQTFEPWQEPAPAPGQSASVLHGPVLFVPALQVLLQPGTTGCPAHREEVSPEEELRAERQAQARGAGGAVRRADGIFGTRCLMTHKLIGVVAEFGIGSGGPNRHPTAVQFRLLLPVWVEVSWLRVRLGRRRRTIPR